MGSRHQNPAPQEHPSTPLKQRLREVYAAALRLDMDPADLPDTGLAEFLGLDSLASYEILVSIEAEFDLEIEDDLMHKEFLDSLDRVAAHVDSHRS
jgi:acyl carrier protein